MFLSWGLDERPRWWVRLVFDVDRSRPRPGRPEAIQVGQALVATGRVRAPNVRFAGGQAVLSLLVKGGDDLDATVAALAIVDSATRDAGVMVLRDLVQRAVRSREGQG